MNPQKRGITRARHTYSCSVPLLFLVLCLLLLCNLGTAMGGAKQHLTRMTADGG